MPPVTDRFSGKTVLITGAARGIGAATAARFAAEGADVVIADFDLSAAEESAAAIGGRAVRCDVTSREQVEAAVEAAAAPSGRLDVLVTCAGIIRDNLFHKLTDDDWEAVIATHLRGTFLSVQAAQRLMVAQKSGSMVLISSTSALGNRGQANYAAAKAGIQGLAKTLAIELGPFGITVNCVAPGFIATAMTEQRRRAWACRSRSSPRQSRPRRRCAAWGSPTTSPA
jgi:3-oxoacyl-[acyl-carrier protein] reductase